MHPHPPPPPPSTPPTPAHPHHPTQPHHPTTPITHHPAHPTTLHFTHKHTKINLVLSSGKITSDCEEIWYGRSNANKSFDYRYPSIIQLCVFIIQLWASKNQWRNLIFPLWISSFKLWIAIIQLWISITSYFHHENTYFIIGKYGWRCHTFDMHLWLHPLPWASVHWLVHCTLECHCKATGWPSVCWDTTGRPSECLQGTLGHHWTNLVETGPHWNCHWRKSDYCSLHWNTTGGTVTAQAHKHI